MSDSMTISLNGVTALPPGKVAAIETSLEMFERPPFRPDPPGTGAFSLDPMTGPDSARYLAIYRMLGERWMWFSRLLQPEGQIAALLANPAIACFAVRAQGRDVGLLELDFRVEGQGEISFFGLDETVLGQGAGRWLMNRTLELAWARPIGRLWVHTCTLDHPGALEFYRRSGFVVFKRGIEIADDPRLGGQMPPTAVPHHPVIAG